MSIEKTFKEDVKKALKYWTKPLGFKDWKISLQFKEMKTKDGRNFWNEKDKIMAIVIDPTTSMDAECIILHELIHPFLGPTNDTMANCVMEGFIQNVADILKIIRKNRGDKL